MLSLGKGGDKLNHSGHVLYKKGGGGGGYMKEIYS